MATVQNTKPLSSRTVETMQPGDKIKADTGENIVCMAIGWTPLQ